MWFRLESCLNITKVQLHFDTIVMIVIIVIIIAIVTVVKAQFLNWLYGL